MDECKERDVRKDEYKAVSKLKKLTILELEKLLTSVCEKSGYVQLEFSSAEVAKTYLFRSP